MIYFSMGMWNPPEVSQMMTAIAAALVAMGAAIGLDLPSMVRGLVQAEGMSGPDPKCPIPRCPGPLQPTRDGWLCASCGCVLKGMK